MLWCSYEGVPGEFLGDSVRFPAVFRLGSVRVPRVPKRAPGEPRAVRADFRLSAQACSGRVVAMFRVSRSVPISGRCRASGAPPREFPACSGWVGGGWGRTRCLRVRVEFRVLVECRMSSDRRPIDFRVVLRAMRNTRALAPAHRRTGAHTQLRGASAAGTCADAGVLMGWHDCWGGPAVCPAPRFVRTAPAPGAPADPSLRR